jgi:hypothetical protein
VLTLQIRGNVFGGTTMLSDPFSIYIGCTIVPNIVLADKKAPRDNFPNAWWRFNSFTVTPTGCPDTFTYSLVDGDGSTNF